MNKIFRILSISLLILWWAGVDAQEFSADTSEYPYWIEMMQDESIAVPDVIDAFEQYWEGREITRGSGWKPFMRWAYYQTLRMHPDGSRATNAELLQAWKETAPLRDSEMASGNWQILGPVQQPPIVNSGQPNGLGRVNGLGFHPTNASIIYVGAASGGLWKTTDGGQSWQPLTDQLPTLGVSSILVDPINPSVVYLGTGDRDANDAPGIGVMKSVDGGSNWAVSNTGMGDLTVGDMIFHLSNSSIIVAATNAGIYRSTDAGQTWQLKAIGNFKDIDQHPIDPSIFYGTASGKFYRSTDTANTWTQVSGVPVVSRMMIATTAANPDMVYLLLANHSSFNSLHRSLNTGLSFTEMSDSPNIMDWSTDGSGGGGQAWYDLAFTASPVNPNEIYTGGVNVWKSTDGGANWFINAHWTGSGGNPAVHADCHWLGYSPAGRLYTGNDGGVYYTDNGGNTWTEISSGLAISQIYKIGQSVTMRDRVMAGYQDNGTTVYNSSGWLTVAGGDGMEAAVDPTDAAYTYGSYYRGDIYRLTNDDYDGKIAGDGTNGITEDGAWVTPFVISEDDPNTMFVGMVSVWRSTNVKANSTNAVNWSQHNTGLSSGDCLDLELSPADADLLYVSKYNNSFYRTDDASANSINFINLTGDLPHSGQVRSIETHPSDPSTVYILQDRKVFKSEDRGVTWTDLTDNLPDVPMSDVVYYKRSQEGLYLGTDIGVFYRDNYTNGWISFSTGLPAAIQVSELEIWYDPVTGNNDRIRASSYGRGVWESGLYGTQPLADFAASTTLIPQGCIVDFTDLTSGIPDHWEWTFTGAIPDTSSQMNPKGILYPNPGVFPVKLKAWNTVGIDSLAKAGYIIVSDSLLADVNFVVDKRMLCASTAIASFVDQSEHCPENWLWEFSPDSVTFMDGTSENSPDPVVRFDARTSYDLSLTVWNQNGPVTINYEDYIISGGITPPYHYGFESDALEEDGWIVENTDGDNTWKIWDLGSLGQAMGIEIYGTNSLGHTDRLITPPFSLKSLNNASLQFSYAYAQYQPGYSDSLRILISEDCGNTWSTLVSMGEDGSGNFATSNPSTTSFVPSLPQDWCGVAGNPDCITIDLGAFVGQEDVRIAFESYSYLSNNLFIDDVRVNPFAGIEDLDREDIKVLTLWPNPVREKCYFENPVEGNSSVSLYDIMGNIIRKDELSGAEGETLEYSLGGLSPGHYFLKVSGGDGEYLARISLL